MSAGLRKITRTSRSVSVRSSRRVSASSPLMPMLERSWRAGSSKRPLGRATVNGGMLAPYPLDARAQGLELLLQRLVTTIEVIHARDLRLALGGQPGQHERSGGAQVGSHHGRSLVGVDPAHHGHGAVGLDGGAHAAELGHVHEAILENGLGDLAGAV